MTSETRLVGYILAQLSLRPGAYYWRANTGAAQTRSGRRIRFGKKGQADILGCDRGRFLAIEVKSETGRQSKEQKQFQQRIETSGGIYILARKLDDVFSRL